MNKLLAIVIILSGLCFADCTPTPSGGTGGTGWDTPTSTSITFHWTTPSACTSRVFYGPTDAWGSYTALADTGGVTNHTVTVSGLLPNHYYVFTAVSGTPSSGASAGNAYFNSGGYIATAAPPAGGFTYSTALYGGRYLYRNYYTLVTVDLNTLTGTSVSTTVSISGLPAGVTATFPTAASGSCAAGVDSSTQFHVAANQYANESCGFRYSIKLSASNSATLGDFTLSVTVTPSSGPAPQTVTQTIHVGAVSFTHGTPSSYPSITNLSQFNSKFVTYFDRWGTIESPPSSGTYISQYYGYGVSATCQNCTVYYDGMKVYYRAGQYATSHAINVSGWVHTPDYYAGQDSKVYYTFINSSGYPQPINRFAYGIYEDCANNGTTGACTAADYMAFNNVSYGAYGEIEGYTDYAVVRETAYSFWMSMVGVLRSGGTATDVYGYTYNQNATATLTRLMMQIDGIVDGYDTTMGEQSFMNGLAVAALAFCYGNSSCPYYNQDILLMYAKKLTDHTQSSYWYPSESDYIYNSNYTVMQVGNGPQYVALNNLIAPMNAFMFRATGDSTYATNYNAAFAPIGLDANIGYIWETGSSPGGKNISQLGYWGFDGIDCMTPGYSCYGIPYVAAFSPTFAGVSVGGVVIQ